MYNNFRTRINQLVRLSHHRFLLFFILCLIHFSYKYVARLSNDIVLYYYTIIGLNVVRLILLPSSINSVVYVIIILCVHRARDILLLLSRAFMYNDNNIHIVRPPISGIFHSPSLLYCILREMHKYTV